jgi:hypothetical protein
MDRFVGKTLIARDGSGIGREAGAGLLSPLVNILIKCGLLTEDLDYHIVRAAMVIIFFSFGYQKWWAYEAQRLIPYISHGPLIFWLYPVFGVRGASWFLGSCEWSFGTCCCWAFGTKSWVFWARSAHALRLLAPSRSSHLCRTEWDASAGGFPAMTGNVPFLMKDVVLLAVSVYLLKQDVQRVVLGSVIRE